MRTASTSDLASVSAAPGGIVADGSQSDIRNVARRLARDTQEAEPAITVSYLFPKDGEIRPIHLDNNSPATEDDEAVTPFYFGLDRSGGIPYLSAIALIRPEEKGQLALPEGWGGWDQADEIRREQD